MELTTHALRDGICLRGSQNSRPAPAIVEQEKRHSFGRSIFIEPREASPEVRVHEDDDYGGARPKNNKEQGERVHLLTTMHCDSLRQAGLTTREAARTNYSAKIFPGFQMPFGSSARFTASIVS